jgi:hypothetical protein
MYPVTGFFFQPLCDLFMLLCLEKVYIFSLRCGYVVFHYMDMPLLICFLVNGPFSEFFSINVLHLKRFSSCSSHHRIQYTGLFRYSPIKNDSEIYMRDG